MVAANNMMTKPFDPRPTFATGGLYILQVIRILTEWMLVIVSD